MKNYLCEGIFLKIYSFVGHNALYLNKHYYKFLVKLRQKFINNPIILKFKIINFKYRIKNKIINLNNRSYKPSIKVDKKIYSIKIYSNIYLGRIIPSEIFYHSEYEIIPSKQLKSKILPEDLIYSLVGNYINSNFKYKDIITMWNNDINKIKEYNNIWVNPSKIF